MLIIYLHTYISKLLQIYISQIFTVDGGYTAYLPLTHFVLGEPLNSGLRNFTQETIYDVIIIIRPIHE